MVKAAVMVKAVVETKEVAAAEAMVVGWKEVVEMAAAEAMVVVLNSIHHLN